MSKYTEFFGYVCPYCGKELTIDVEENQYDYMGAVCSEFFTIYSCDNCKEIIDTPVWKE